MSDQDITSGTFNTAVYDQLVPNIRYFTNEITEGDYKDFKAQATKFYEGPYHQWQLEYDYDETGQVEFYELPGFIEDILQTDYPQMSNGVYWLKLKYHIWLRANSSEEETFIQIQY